MSEIVVTVTAQISGQPPASHQTTTPIPPEYEPDDVEQLLAVAIEQTAGQLLERDGRRRPEHDALLADDARMLRLEQITARMPRSGPLADIQLQLQEILDVDAGEAIDRWGEPPED